MGAGGSGEGTRHQPTARALASWLCALWGRHKGARGGGHRLPGCVASAVGRFPSPDRPSLGRAARAHYPLAVGAGGVGVGTRHKLNSAGYGVLTLRALGAGRGRPGGASLPRCRVSAVGSSPSPDRPSLGRAAASRYPLAVGAGAVGAGTRYQPHSARSCELALRPLGAARERSGGAPLACVCSVRGWALSQARPTVFGACSWGPLPTGCGCGGRGRGEPSPTPQRAVLRADCARWGGGTRAPRGRACCLLVRRPGLGALPRPAARPWGVRPGPATHWLWMRGVWALGPVTNPTVRAIAS